jgi:hypothetical protein
MINKQCAYCSTEFSTTNPQKLYCCIKCASKSSRANLQITLDCPVCGKQFSTYKTQPAICCSKSCGYAYIRINKLNELSIKVGMPIYDYLVDMYINQKVGIKKIAKSLGISDHGLWNYFEYLNIPRRERSEAVATQWIDNDERRKLSSDLMRKISANNTGDNNPAKNPAIRRKISLSKMGDNNPMYNKFGSLNPNWKGGKLTERGKGWRGIRVQVRRRDGNKCRICGNTERLSVHHIIPWRLTHDNSFSNLITLCGTCHPKVECGKLPLQLLMFTDINQE